MIRRIPCPAIRCGFVNVFVEPGVSSIVSRQWVQTCDASLSSDGSPCTGFPAVSSTMKALRLPDPNSSDILFRRSVPRLPAGVRVLRSRRSRRRAGPAANQGFMVSRFSTDRSGPPGFPCEPSRGFATVFDPGRPLVPHRSRRGRCCPRHVENEGVVECYLEARFRRFDTGCVGLTTVVAARHATRASGWQAVPLPDGSRTRRLAMKGF